MINARVKFLIFILFTGSILLWACQGSNHTESKEQEIERKQSIPPPPPDQPTTDEKIWEEDDHVQQEIENLKKEVSEKIKSTENSSQLGYSENILKDNYSLAEFGQEMGQNPFKNLPVSPTYTFRKEDVQGYDFSSYSSQKDDGHKFILLSESIPNQYDMKLVFGRSEGGHTSDGVDLYLTNKERNKLAWLVLFSEFGKEGYHRTISSEFTPKSGSINRTIVEAFGNFGKEDPRRTIEQSFKISSSGELVLQDEKVSTKNFESYLSK